ncbi:SagB/ThcOx family dehydrogenase [Candidatus Thorarchaeota archaeon]|nr:MAG: SagB/ThcOx family dehydrogenase [Candidatus Thorarchaeota archaeon]
MITNESVNIISNGSDDLSYRSVFLALKTYCRQFESWYSLTKYEETINTRRNLLKAHDYDETPNEDWWEPHQRKGVAPPPLEKPFLKEGVFVDLVKPEDFISGNRPLREVIDKRRSRRKFVDTPLTLEEVSFLLWSTQGVRKVDKNLVWTLRTVPSGGARHPFETYLVINWVEGITSGIYRYLPIEHRLLLIKKTDSKIQDKVSSLCWDQTFCGKSAIFFIWAVIPYKSEWRYSIVAYKDIAIEAGHICQNLYLACESIRVGTCAIAAYNQKGIDELIGVDGKNEFTIYVAPVGKIGINSEEEDE